MMFSRRCVVLVLLLTASSLRAQDWHRFAGPNGNLKVSKGPALLRDWPEEGPALAWILPHEGLSAAGPAIADGKVYLVEREVKKDLDILKCVRLEDGELLWRFEHHSPIDVQWEMGRGTPWVQEDRVFFSGNAGDLYCVRAKDGELLWHKQVFEMFDARYFDLSTTHETKKGIGWSSSPIVEKGKVIVAPQGKKGTLAAFDARTGDLIWQTEFLGDGSHASPIVDEVAGKRQIIMPLNDLCVGVDPTDGALLWKIKLDCRIRFCASAAVIEDDRIVLVTEGFAPFVLKVRSGQDGALSVEQIHRFDFHCGGDFRPVETDKHLFMLCQHRYKAQPGLYCVDKETFESKWMERGDPPFGWGPMLMADGVLLVLSQQGVLSMIEPTGKEYREIAKAKVIERARGWNTAVWAHAGISDGRFIGRAKGVTVCVDLRKSPK